MNKDVIAQFIVWGVILLVISLFVIPFCFCKYKEDKEMQERIKTFDNTFEHEKQSIKNSNLLFLYGLLHSKNKVLKIKKVPTWMNYDSGEYSTKALIITYEDGTRRLERIYRHFSDVRAFEVGNITFHEEIEDFWWIEEGIEFDIEDFEELIYKTFKIKELEEV